MYNLTGCLISLIIFLGAVWLLNELWRPLAAIALIIIVYYWGKKIYTLLCEKKQSSSYNPEMGDVYKVCPYCGSKVRAAETVCPVCSKTLN